MTGLLDSILNRTGHLALLFDALAIVLHGFSKKVQKQILEEAGK
jgi:hypothetical protein